MSDSKQRKRILLVHPLGYPREAASKDISRLANIMPPLGLAGIAAYLEREGFPTSIIDCYARPEAESGLMEEVRGGRAGLVGFSCTTSSFLDGARLAREIKAVAPGVRTVFGGVHVSAMKEKALRDHPEIDFAVVGEGESVLAELAGADGEGCRDIPGLVCRDGNGEPAFSGYPEKLMELDDLPFPDYRKLAGFPGCYPLPMFNYPRVPNATCISSRGCPYSCSYCDRSVFRRTFRFNSADYMIEHMKYLRRDYGVRHVNFYDDQFTFNRDRVMAFCAALQSATQGMTFNCAARAEHLDEELLREMKGGGCWMISLGIETGDAELLARHRSSSDLEQVTRAIHLVSDAGIRVKGLFMIGLPGETEASIRRSVDYMLGQPIDDINVAKFTPFPGSPVYDRIRDYGEFEEDWPSMDCMTFRFVPEGMTRERLEELFTAFYRAHFLRARTILDYVTMIWRSPDSWRRFWLNAFRFLAFAFTRRRFGSRR